MRVHRRVVLPVLAASMLGSGCAHPRVVGPPVQIPPPAADTSRFELAPAAEVSAAAIPPPMAEAPRACPRGEWSPPTDPDFSGVEAAARATLHWTGTPSISIGVAVGGEVLWTRSFGDADLARHRKATPDTPYSLASVSKPITATALMVLAQNGDIDIEQPINTYLPDPGVRAGAGDPADATVARVASHTAGLGLHYQFFYDDEPARPPAPAETRRRHAVLVTPPGERYLYSNLGFGLLEHVVAAVSGRSYADFVRASVFGPLHMDHAFVGTPPRGAKVAVRYGGDRRPLPGYGFDHDGASAVWASVHDLLRFGALFANAPLPDTIEILARPTRRRMFRVTPPSATYGLGWGVRRVDGRPLVSHNGGMPGVRTVLQVFPADGLVITVLANSDVIGDGHTQLAQTVLDALQFPARADSICALPPGHALIGTWRGTIDTDAGNEPAVLTLTRDGDVTLQTGDRPPWIVRGARFEDDRLDGEVALVRSDAGEPAGVGLHLHLSGDRLHGPVSTVHPWRSATSRFMTLSRD
jgi:CubicO group peptidase (beta-lactamase class C family)